MATGMVMVVLMLPGRVVENSEHGDGLGHSIVFVAVLGGGNIVDGHDCHSVHLRNGYDYGYRHGHGVWLWSWLWSC